MQKSYASYLVHSPSLPAIVFVSTFLMTFNFFGELLQTYADDGVMTDGNIDIAKLRPLIFDMASKKVRVTGVVRRQSLEYGQRPENEETRMIMNDKTLALTGIFRYKTMLKP